MEEKKKPNQHLLDNGADIEAKDESEFTVLIRASYQGNKEVVQLLLDNGADIDAKDESEFTVLIWASYKGNKEIVQLLLDNGADIEAKNRHEWTALILASYEGNKEVVQLLLDNGADIEVKDNFGQTALMTASMTASEKGNKEIVQLLLDNGADIEVKDDFGQTALILALHEGNEEIVQLLLDNSADIEIKDNFGQTVLMIASKKGYTETVQLLLDNGADIEAKSKNSFNRLLRNRTSLIQNKIVKFIANSMLNILEFILYIMIVVLSFGKNNRNTALIKASSNGHKAVVELLIENGANVEFIRYMTRDNPINPKLEKKIEKVVYSIFSAIYGFLFRGTPLASIENKELLKEELKKDRQDLNDFILHYKYIANQKKTISNPKRLIQLLTNFTIDTPIKYSTHLWDFSSLKEEYTDFKGFINEIDKQWRVIGEELKELSPKLHEKIYNFLLNDNTTKSWCSKADITVGWSSLDGLEEWCNEGKNPFDFELKESIEVDNQTIATFGEVITLFKKEIEIRNDSNMLENIFLAQKRKLGRAFKMELIKLKGRSFYTDVESFQNAIDRVFQEIQKRKEHKSIKVEVIEPDAQSIEIVITQIGSRANRDIKEMVDEVEDGDFKMLKESLTNLCDWSIESDSENGGYRVNYLSESTQEKSKKLVDTPDGFKHILRFYKK